MLGFCWEQGRQAAPFLFVQAELDTLLTLPHLALGYGGDLSPIPASVSPCMRWGPRVF